jgi:hypothetical protein
LLRAGSMKGLATVWKYEILAEFILSEPRFFALLRMTTEAMEFIVHYNNSVINDECNSKSFLKTFGVKRP